MESIIRVRNKLNGFLYQRVIKPIAFLFDAEKVHKLFIRIGKILGKYKAGKWITREMYYYESKMLSQNIFGIKFVSPVGLSAGFDKNAEIISICEDLSFGFSEVG